jgi:hypothetical protein
MALLHAVSTPDSSRLSYHKPPGLSWSVIVPVGGLSSWHRPRSLTSVSQELFCFKKQDGPELRSLTWGFLTSSRRRHVLTVNLFPGCPCDLRQSCDWEHSVNCRGHSTPSFPGCRMICMLSVLRQTGWALSSGTLGSWNPSSAYTISTLKCLLGPDQSTVCRSIQVSVGQNHEETKRSKFPPLRSLLTITILDNAL